MICYFRFRNVQYFMECRLRLYELEFAVLSKMLYMYF